MARAARVDELLARTSRAIAEGADEATLADLARESRILLRTA